MSKYEIMLILDPKSDEKVVHDIAKTTFKSKELKIERLERTELAYEINKSKTAIYVLVSVEATGKEINEFARKSNISKSIWRFLSINLDTEKGLNRKAKPSKKRKKVFQNKPLSENSKEENDKIKEKVEKTEAPKKEKKSSTTKKTTTKAKEDTKETKKRVSKKDKE